MDEDGGGLVDLCAVIDATAGENNCDAFHHGFLQNTNKAHMFT